MGSATGDMVVQRDKDDVMLHCKKFSAEEDKALLLLVVLFDHNGAIDWSRALRHMSPTLKNVAELQDRLQYLKHVDTTLLDELPAGYVAGSCLRRQELYEAESYNALDYIFHHITRADVNQPPGQPHLNGGELAPVGVTIMLHKLHLTAEDRFVDIGSGSGSVLAQVVLQTAVDRAVGLEIRPDLAEKSRCAMKAAQDKYPRLRKVRVITGDVKVLSYDATAQLCVATVVFCNNLVFQPEDNLGLHRYISTFDLLGDLRAIMLTQRLCPRCSTHCREQFCQFWKQDDVFTVQTCWKKEPLKVYMYRRKAIIHKGLLDIVGEL